MTVTKFTFKLLSLLNPKKSVFIIYFMKNELLMMSKTIKINEMKYKLNSLSRKKCTRLSHA